MVALDGIISLRCAAIKEKRESSVGEPDDIGCMVASLLSDDNRRINGQNIEVAGGYII